MERSRSTPTYGFSDRPASRGSQRPPSSASTVRPSSSTSMRPSSSSSGRPGSSLSTNRPGSSASVNRPMSRLSQRPFSRLSTRANAAKYNALIALGQTLITQVSGLTTENDEENFQIALDYVAANLDYTVKAAPSTDLSVTDRQIKGHGRKARINSQDALANALEASYSKLKTHVEATKDLDQEIQLSRLPDHIRLLLELAQPPTQETLKYASQSVENIRHPPRPPPTLTWKDILAEEPFEGEHWEGVYGLPPGSTVEGWETRSLESTPPLSPLGSDDFQDLERSPSPLDSVYHTEDTSSIPANDTNTLSAHAHEPYSRRQDVEELEARQYFRSGWRTDASLTAPFDLGDAATLGPSMTHALAEHQAFRVDKERYINEHDAVREVLMALQGRKNLLLMWSYNEQTKFSFKRAPDAPRLVHLTSASQMSILESFARTATTLEHLRKFTNFITTRASQPIDTIASHSTRVLGYNRRITRTLEAFTESLDREIRLFETWCAQKEEQLCLAQAGLGEVLIVSLLSLEKSVRDTFSDVFPVLLDILRTVLRRTSRAIDPAAEVWTLAELPARMSPSLATTLLLDTLLVSIHGHISMGDTTTSDALMRVFVEAAEPIWSMVGRWLRDGMPVQDPSIRRGLHGYAFLDDEFFIEDNELTLMDPDFWVEGFVVRGTSDEEDTTLREALPTFLVHIASPVLSAGKAIGLLRALDVPVDEMSRVDNDSWPVFRSLLEKAAQGRGAISVSPDDLEHIVHDELIQRCQPVCAQVAHVIAEECDLWVHLAAIEDLYLMRRGDAMSHFADVLFVKMDTRVSWNDFHTLNSAFRDITETRNNRWINSSLVRLSYRGTRDKSTSRSVKALDGLKVEYTAPFPLSYLFGPTVIQIYGSIFVFLLQIRRAQTTLDRILVRGAVSMGYASEELKLFYALRSKLSWFINTLFDFIATHVLHAQLLKFHESLRKAKSLDDMIQLHNDHLNKLEGRCLLQSKTSALLRTIMSILDMSLYFNDCFVAFAGDVTLDISRQSISAPRTRHRSRRQRQKRRNVIHFIDSGPDVHEESSSEDEEVEDPLQGNAPELSFSMASASISFVEEGFASRIEKMSTELEGLVRFVRRGVESLAGGSSEAAPAFGVFAFALEDWDS